MICTMREYVVASVLPFLFLYTTDICVQTCSKSKKKGC